MITSEVAPPSLPIPLEAIDALEAADLTYTDTTPEAEVQAVATPVVVAELLAFADRLNTLSASAGARYREGFDTAIGEVREMIADRCDELGTRVEDL